MNSAIKIRNLSKRFNLGEIRGYKTIRETLQNMFKLRMEKQDVDYIWALKNVSADIRQGEVAGIIGRNGAGKSTLLKILSRITAPTRGRVTFHGRLVSLLEVGTGFHPELSGRENIYLNGTILGMNQNEIERKFDAIVDFSGVERFLDTPVKRYSSGMYVRLAFSVAAHLQPEILMVDEVLAVGDSAFQKKCLGTMGGVAGSGKTVLFVSHNMAAVEALCTSGILMSNGRVSMMGAMADVIREYSQSIFGDKSVGIVEFTQPGRTTKPIRFLYAGLVDELHVFIGPMLLGPRGRPGAVDWAGPANLADAPTMVEPRWELCGRDAYVHGLLTATTSSRA